MLHLFLLPPGSFEGLHKAQLNPIAAGGQGVLQDLWVATGTQDDLSKPVVGFGCSRRAVISTSWARGMSIRAAEGPLKALSAEGFFGHGYVAGQKKNPVRGGEGF